MLRSKLAMFYLKDLEAANPQRTDAVLESQRARTREPAGEASNLGFEEGEDVVQAKNRHFQMLEPLVHRPLQVVEPLARFLLHHGQAFQQ